MLNEKQLKTIKKICVITLSNIGDVLLTFPAIDALKAQFPQAELSVVVGPKASLLFEGNANIHNVYVYDKHQSFIQFLFWTRILKQERFDLVVDFRHSVIPLFLGARFRTPLFYKRDDTHHMKDKHLDVVQTSIPSIKESIEKVCLGPSTESTHAIDAFIADKKQDQALVVIAPGSASNAKWWPDHKYASLSDDLIEQKNAFVVFIGDALDAPLVGEIQSKMKNDALNLCGKTSLSEAATLIKKANLVITNDSAPCHFASYLDIPVITLFGPTDSLHYGPWGKGGVTLHKNQDCPACNTSQKDQQHTCLDAISVDDVKVCVDRLM
ncbi:glycosyltransferase family 9 protein [Candidatus Omnitrophota bacterium]